MVAQRMLASRSENVRPARIALRAIGKVRKRSITPLFRSVLTPTAVPTDDVVRLNTRSPAMANCV
jgi:hypothetical protein